MWNEYMRGAVSELLTKFLRNQGDEMLEAYAQYPESAWKDFIIDSYDFQSDTFENGYVGIEIEILYIIKDLLLRNKTECQHCRLDHGLSVMPPLRPELLCKRHLQIFEENYVDRTNFPRPNPTWSF
jgi:hypothetical protein